MSQLALSVSFEYLCYGSTDIINNLIPSVRLSEASLYVYRRHILMYKDGPRAERVNPQRADVDYSRHSVFLLASL